MSPVTALACALLLLVRSASYPQTDATAVTPEQFPPIENKSDVRAAARKMADRGFTLAHNSDLKAAIVFFDRAVEIDPTYTPAYYLRAAARLKMLDFAGALPDLDKVLDLDPNYFYALNDRGFARWQMGDRSGALSDFNQCISLNSSWGLPYANRGVLKASLGDMEDAMLDVKEALRIDPSLGSPSPQSLASIEKQLQEAH